MARFLTLLALAALVAAEVAAVVALVDWLGGVATLMLLGLDMLLGMVVMSRAARSAAPDRGWRILAGAFIALPGLVLDVVGLLLLVPAVRNWAKAHLVRGTQSALRRRGVSVVTVTDSAGVPHSTVVAGDVIPGEVVEVVTEEPADTPGQDGPPVIRGELSAD